MTASAIIRLRLAAAADLGAAASSEMFRGPVDPDTLEQCRREVSEMLGVYPVGATRTRDACAVCGDPVEPDAVGWCCGTEIAKDEVFAMHPEHVTAETVTAQQARAIHRHVGALAAPTRSQLMLLAACERVIDGCVWSTTARLMTLVERRAVASMALEDFRGLVAAAWNDAAPRLQEVRP